MNTPVTSRPAANDDSLTFWSYRFMCLLSDELYRATVTAHIFDPSQSNTPQHTADWVKQLAKTARLDSPSDALVMGILAPWSVNPTETARAATVYLTLQDRGRLQLLSDFINSPTQRKKDVLGELITAWFRHMNALALIKGTTRDH